jgi:gliding motility-associated-like protein
MARLHLFYSLFLSLLCFQAFATHNRAGEITYRHLGGYQYEATITTYTKSDSPADRNALGMNWGDGSVDTIPRINGSGAGEIVSPGIKKNIYRGVHTYPAPAIYNLSFEDPNRNGGVVNIPNSINIPFFVSTQLIINPFLGINNSVQLLNPPIDEACPGQLFIHNPGAFDPDGDSLSYRLTECLGEGGLPIPGFSQPLATNSFSLNPITGDLTWNTPLPNAIGEYNVAFFIEEWRNGVKIGFVVRDMQINLVPCTNQPPVINALPDLCVDAGTIISFPVLASDTDIPFQQITLSATGGPFSFESPFNAQFAPVTSSGWITQGFLWATDCRHVRKQPYLFSFKVIDNGNPNLADFESVQIKVVAQAPENLTTSPIGNSARLNWNSSPCPQAIGYAIYRRTGFFGFNHAQCETGVPAYTGYTLLDTINGLGNTTYLDSNQGIGLVPGRNYCYMVIALFSDGAESYASNESCISLENKFPVITNVSVRYTSNASGSVYVAWSKPSDLDTLQWTGPYRYIIARTSGISGSAFQDIDSLFSLNDTTYIDSSSELNTVSNALRYQINLRDISTGISVLIGSSEKGSSVFLNAVPLDNSIELSWTLNVPWDNSSYVILRKLPGSATFDSIGVTNFNNYSDIGLSNGLEYCYKIKSIGNYSAGGFISPIINFSQEICSTPRDTQAPCEPILAVSASCDSLKNVLNWNYDDPACFPDVVSFNIYYAPTLNDSMQLLSTQLVDLPLSFLHLPGSFVAGCYGVTAVDSFQNESGYTKVCVDNCPKYELPNTFSPNGDGVNDSFRPFPYAFIDHIELSVFNRWGYLMFETRNVDIAWDGRAKSTQKLVTDGVYFYSCIVYEMRLEGLVSRKLKGTIQVIGGKDQSPD